MNETIPNNLEQAIEYLDKLLQEEDKEYLFKEYILQLEKAALSVHYSLGRWIRNNWGLWNEEDNELKANLKKLGYEHPDDMSNYIIEQYLKHLKDTHILRNILDA